MGAINYDLKKIKAVFLDIDGVISPETMVVGADGNPLRSVNVKDAYTIQLAVKCGIIIAVISGGHCQMMEERLRRLGVENVIMRASSKVMHFEKLLSENNLHPDEVIYIGDDIPDYHVMQKCGLPCCPKDAANDILSISKYISGRRGGKGCVRDVLEQVLRAKGKWMTDEAFEW